MQQSVIIKSRFNGPPESGNGGYVCGLLASMFEGGAEASLRIPPPLDVELLLAREGDTATLTYGDTLVGTATAKSCDIAVPALPQPLALGINPVDAPDAPGAFRPFDSCFVCGEARDHGDGLCIHSKQVQGHVGMVAAPWKLFEGLSDKEGNVDPVYMWSALDCPGYFACAPGEAALLARLTAEVLTPVKAEGEATVIAWDLAEPGAEKGRKRRCGSAVYAPDGTLAAKAEGLWITIDPAKLKG